MGKGNRNNEYVNLTKEFKEKLPQIYHEEKN
jgi:hypothetical protein